MATQSTTLWEYAFLTFSSSNLDPDTMTFIYDSTYIPWRHIACANMNFLCQDFLKLLFDRETDMTEIIGQIITIWFLLPLKIVPPYTVSSATSSLTS